MNNKIALFLPSLSGGGAERVMVTLANGLAHRDYNVDLVLASAQGPYLTDVVPSVRIVDLRAGRVIKALWPLARYLRRERPVAMLSALNHANVVAVLAKALAGLDTRLVISEHITISVSIRQARGWSARCVSALVPRIYRMANAIVAVSHDAARDLERFAGLPTGLVQTIYNPFDLERIQRLAVEAVLPPWLQPGQTRPVLVAVGRLTEQKDFPTLLRAFALVRQQSDARLMILGEGEQRGALEWLVAELGLEECVAMPGFVENPYAYMRRASLLVLSSQCEGLPTVLIEAMACGTPVVATDCPSGPREILEDGRWGRLVPVGDVDALAQAILAVLQTPRGHLPDVRERARDFAQERAIDAYLAALGMASRITAATARARG